MPAQWSSCRRPFPRAAAPPTANPQQPAATQVSSAPDQQSPRMDKPPTSRNHSPLALALRFEHRLALKQNPTQRSQRLRRGTFPELALRCLKQPFGNRVQCPGIGSSKKRTHLLRQRIVLRQPLINEIRSNLRRSIETKNIINRR